MFKFKKEFNVEDIRNYFNDPPALDLNVSKNEISRYRIEMKNDYMDSTGNVTKRQHLESIYTRKITGKIRDYLYLTEITLDEVKFESENKSLNWTFAEGTTIPFYLFSCRYLKEFEYIKSEIEDGLIKKQLDNLTAIFTRFPKLPSVSLFILHVFDMVGFENINCHLLSYPVLLNYPGTAIELQTVSETSTNLTGGSFSEGSFYKNGKVFAVNHGLNLFQDKICMVIEFFCDEAKLKSKSDSASKSGTSTYSGVMYIDLKTGLIMKTMMKEYLFTTQRIMGADHKKKVRSLVRRIVNLEALSENNG